MIYSINFIVENLIKILSVMILLNTIFKNKFVIGNWFYATITSIIVVVSPVASYFASVYLVDLPYFNVFYPLFWSMIIFAISNMLIKAGSFKILFTVFLLSTYVELAFAISELIKPLVIHLVPEEYSYLILIGVDAGIILITIPVMLIFINFLYKKVLEHEKVSEFWIYTSAIPVLFYTFLGFGTYTTIYKIIAYIFALLIYIVVLLIFNKVQVMLSEKERIQILDILTSTQYDKFLKINSNILDARKTRQDFRHQLITITNYIKINDIASLLNYLESYLFRLSEEDGKPVCDSPTINAIIQYYTYNAHRNDVDTNISVELPKTYNINEDDYCVILSSLLENALEACIKYQDIPNYITLKIAVKEENLFTSISNTFSNEIIIEDNKYISSKRDGFGLGIEMVKDIIRRHNGVCNFDYHDNIFDASCLINFNEQKTD